MREIISSNYCRSMTTIPTNKLNLNTSDESMISQDKISQTVPLSPDINFEVFEIFHFETRLNLIINWAI